MADVEVMVSSLHNICELKHSSNSFNREYDEIHLRPAPRFGLEVRKERFIRMLGARELLPEFRPFRFNRENSKYST